MTAQTKSITAQNTFTNLIDVGPGDRAAISLSGTWGATVTLQRRFPGASPAAAKTAWFDVESWSGNIETSYVVDVMSQLRLGVKTGDFTSGTVAARIEEN